ncbi:MAG: NAD-dependent epimerase/dehydratase family protein [Anaerolineales bacterium]|nr:MAG: NAD-dependent epimerase/dehydratase family protein [Anaerolineales bacterium]
MRERVVLVTGANGEVGHGLITYLGERGDVRIVALDIQALGDEIKPYCFRTIQGDILDSMLLGRLVTDYQIETIYHLASVLSTSAEYNPEAAHRVNVEGTLNLLHLALEQSNWQQRSIKFLYPSSIAIYGLGDLDTKAAAGRVGEDQFNRPITMYGCNKLYCEHLGRYYAHHYQQLAVEHGSCLIDFRSLRFPGLISATTVPTGGTSDYGPEMLHHAAKGEPYACFVQPAAQLPFMAMPDAVKALVDLEAVPAERLTRQVYNVTSFSLTARQFLDYVLEAFPGASIRFESDPKREAIVNSWPADLNDDAARQDWGWRPDFDVDRAFKEYLIPTIGGRYS